MTREDALRKVEACMKLSKSNEVNEAKDALLMAQKLMAKYHIEETEVADVTEGSEHSKDPVIQVTNFNVLVGRDWVRHLGQVIAKNFKCCCYISSYGGKHYEAFVGYETDAKLASDIFEAAFKWIERSSSNKAQTYNDKGLSSKGVKASFCKGFVSGLDLAFREQVEQNQSFAIMIVPPEEAVKALEGMKMFKGGITQEVINGAAYNAGKKEGYEYGNRKQIEGGNQ